ncbi:MAG: FecR domain-containing protein [Proteobacteria bacterium]|nr:FecR domain-containing protein [Pseudomonadota bacterium]
MSNVADFPDLPRAREEAAEWIARASRGLTAEERAELDRWRASPANARALEQLSALWKEMDVLRELSSIFPEPPAEVVAAPAPTSASARPRRYAIAAALALVTLATGFALQHYFAADRSPGIAARAASSEFTTVVGEQRNVPLPDGSVLAINTASQVQVVALGSQSRELRLVRGEAHFTVAHDAARPFRVTAGGHVVQALGTAFDVKLLAGGGLEVIVTEGHVRLLSGNGSVGDLLKGQFMLIDTDGQSRVGELGDDALASRLAWRNGMLAFQGEPLADALREFSRYTNERFAITDPRLRELRIGGYFTAGDTDALRDALRTNFGIASRRGTDGVIQIGPEPGPAALQ